MGADGGIVSEPGADVNWGRAGFEANPAPASIPRRIRSRVCPDGDHEGLLPLSEQIQVPDDASLGHIAQCCVGRAPPD